MKLSAGIIIAVLLVIMTGCATPPPKVEAPVFFPSDSEFPRIQYLKSYSSAKDVEASQSGFDIFVKGAKKGRTLDKPYGVAIYNGKIYVCDTNYNVYVFDLEKKDFYPLAGAQGLGKLVQPLNISIDAEGNKYVTDTVRKQVIVFDKNDFYRSSINLPVEWRPVDTAAYEDLLYVLDMKNKVVQIFDKKTGALRKEILKGELGLPTNIAIDRQGYIFISDAGRFQVLKADRDGHIVSTIGKLGTNPGEFARPKGVAVDRDDDLFVVDAAFDNVQIFNRNGQILLFFAKAGLERGDLQLPAKIVVDYDNLRYFQQYVDPGFEMDAALIVTSQFGQRMVNVYALGKLKGKKYPTEEEVMKMLEDQRKKFKEEHPDKANEPEEGREPAKLPEGKEPAK